MSIKNRLISSKATFIISLIILTLVIIGTWIVGIKDENTITENAFISLSIIATSLFFFLTIGLYQGLKMKDTLGNPLTWRKEKSNQSDSSLVDIMSSSDMDFDAGDGVEGIITSIITWIFVTIALGILLWFFSAFVGVLFTVIVAMLYWIFFRALRLVFKNSSKCRNNLLKSFSYALSYTFMYTGWLFLLFYGIKILR